MHPALRLFGVGLFLVLLGLLALVVHDLLSSVLEAELLSPVVVAVPLSPDGLAALVVALVAFAVGLSAFARDGVPLANERVGTDGDDD